MSLLMHEIDGSEGRDNPPHVKRTRRVFPRPIYKASSACALRCSSAANSCENAVERSPLLIIFHEGFVKKQSVYSGSIIRPSLITPFLDPTMNVFRSQILFGYLMDLKMVIFQACIFRYRFRVGLQQKKGSIFR